MDLRAAIHAYMAREGVGQTVLAARAGVSQTTVSRVLRLQAIRSGQARVRLVAFMHKEGVTTSPAAAQTALGLVWDGSDAHAEALAELIRASRELWPGLAEEEGDGGRRTSAKVTP